MRWEKFFLAAPEAPLLREADMTVSIIIRAQDPVACANFYRELGIPFDTQDRRRPGVRLARFMVEIELVQDDTAVFDPRLSVASIMPVVARTLEQGGSADLSRAHETPPVVTLRGPAGETVTLEEAPARRFQRPVMDSAMVHDVMAWLRPNRAELLSALGQAGMASPRLLGPVSLGSRAGGEFVLVVDGGEDADPETANAFLESVRTGSIRVTARLSATLPADRRDFLEAVAFEI